MNAWASAACEALESVAGTALELPAIRRGAVPRPASAAIGAYIPVMTPGESLQIGLVADDASCDVLVRALLHMPAPEELSAGDVADAFGEIANMVGGVAKAAMSPAIGLVGLGLPLVTHGLLAQSDSLELAYESVEVGAAHVTLVVARARAR